MPLDSMQRLPEALEERVLEYVFPCAERPCGAAAVCRGWAGHRLRLASRCESAAAVACPELRLCRVHQRAELELWAALWEQTHTLHRNPFPLRSPHLGALRGLRRRMAAHQLPFDVCAVVETVREAWIFIAPGNHATLWWRRYCAWKGVSEDH